MKKYCSLAFCAFVFWGCSTSENTKIADLQRPQDATLYVKNQVVEDDPKLLESLKNEYLKKFFAPFNGMQPNLDTQEVFWIQGSLKKNFGYSENLKKHTEEFSNSLLDQMQIDLYPSIAQKAIIIKDSDVRAVPTLKPRYSKEDGYPFDRWQNSLIFYGTPVLITHYDKTKRFAHIQTEFVYGWVEVSNLALVGDEQAKMLSQSKNFVMPKDDSLMLYDKNQNFLTQARVGKIFILSSKDSVLGFVRASNGKLRVENVKINPQDFVEFPQPFSQEAVAGYINDLVGQKYGWGGMYESRDCSAFIRDIYANFGLYLPRNSFAQAQYGTHQIKLDGLSLEEKEKMIIKNAAPFGSILWLKGHIMLYLGTDKEGRVMVAHSAWSVQTKDIFSKQEHKLGGVVITTLTPANEHNGIWVKGKTLGDRVGIENNLFNQMRSMK